MPKQLLAIALCRVSSLEQLKNGSLGHQKDNVLKAAEFLGVSIPSDGIWSGHVSSKKGVNVDRKDLHQMILYCKKNQNVKYLIIQEVDRFMRSPDEQMYWEVKFKHDVDVKIWYADKPELNKGDIYSGLMRYLEGFRAAGSNDERQRKSINGQTKAIQEGRYPFSPKPGYKKGLRVGIPEIHPIRGVILRNVLLDIVEGRATPSQALINLNNSAFTNGHSAYKMDKFRKIVTDPFYAGILEIKKQVNIRNENGLHNPLISKKQHYILVGIMNAKKKNQAGPRKDHNSKYPLNNIVSCTKCLDKSNGRVVGFNHGNGKKNSTLIYEKYRCRSCSRYINRQTLHEAILKHIDSLSINSDGYKELLKALDIVWKQYESENVRETIRINDSINQLREIINTRAMAAIDPTNTVIKQELLDSISKHKEELRQLEVRLLEVNNRVDFDKSRFLTFALSFVDDMGSNFLNLSHENRLRCKQVMFPAGFYWDTKDKVYTPQISPLITLATNKKARTNDARAHLVRHKLRS